MRKTKTLDETLVHETIAWLGSGLHTGRAAIDNVYEPTLYDTATSKKKCLVEAAKDNCGLELGVMVAYFEQKGKSKAVRMLWG